MDNLTGDKRVAFESETGLKLPPETIDIREAAKLIGKSADTVRRLVHAGRLPQPIDRRGWWRWDAKKFKASLGAKPADLKWTKDKPTVPGWYWCRRDDDTERSPAGWQAVVFVQPASAVSGFSGYKGLVCTWIVDEVFAQTITDEEWQPECWWAGPLVRPEE